MAADWLNIGYGAVSVLFLLTGGLLMGFAVMGRNLISAAPTLKNVAEALLLNECPLTAAIVNATFAFSAFLLCIPVFMRPSSRSWLRAQGWAVVFCAVFTLVLGLVIWFMTLKTRANLAVVWSQQDAARQSLLQQRFDCCSYLNATSPRFITDQTCPNQFEAAQKQGCVEPLANFANRYMDLIFTAAFGVVGLDVIMLLCVVMMIKRRQELERYRHIDAKNAFGGL